LRQTISIGGFPRLSLDRQHSSVKPSFTEIANQWPFLDCISMLEFHP
jgi:hypothetical protein